MSRSIITESPNISDPTEFLKSSLPELADVDSLLRCHICKDFLQIPVLGQCGHTFCSICIREYLNRENRCPLCLTELRQTMLQKEFLLGETVASYVAIRSKILKILTKNCRIETVKLDGINDEAHIEISSDDDVHVVDRSGSSDLKRPLMENASLQVVKKVQKTKSSGIRSLLSNKATDKDGKVICPICNKLYTKYFLERTHLDECLSVCAIQQVNPNQEPETYLYTGKDDRKMSEHSVHPSNSSLLTNNTITIRANDDQAKLCDVNLHTRKYLESGFIESRSRLPKLHFANLSTNQIKQRLLELNLSTSGSRQQMMNRYNHYEILWNSNFLDSINPVSEQELRKNLVIWETSHNLGNVGATTKNGSIGIANMLRGTQNSNNQALSLLKNFKTDRFDKAGWVSLHSKSFKELIREAKNGLKKQQVKEKE